MNNKKIEKVIDYLYLALEKAQNENKYRSGEKIREFIDLMDSIVDDSYTELIDEYLE